MEYRALGRTGISVSHLTLGAMMFGAMGNQDHEECVRIVHRALEAGITSINTADGYSAGQSEEIVGEALTGGRRDEVVLSVKTGVKLDGNPNHGGGSRRWFTQAVEGSLRRLGTDYIDVYELGAPDPQTDLDETLGALTDLVAAGKVRSFGTSKMPPSLIAEARSLAERRGHGVFRTEEAPYSILNRVVEYDLLPVCQRARRRRARLRRPRRRVALRAVPQRPAGRPVGTPVAPPPDGRVRAGQRDEVRRRGCARCARRRTRAHPRAARHGVGRSSSGG